MKKRIVCLTLALLMSATQVVSVSASREDELREEQAITSQQLDATYSRMDELAYAKSQLENEISELDSNLVSVMVSIDTLKGDIDNKEVDIIKTKQDLAKAQKARDKQYESMKLRIQALYEQGGDAAWFQMMLNSEDLSELLTRAENTQQMYEQDRESLQKYARTIEEVQKLEDQYEQEKADFETMKEEYEAQQSNLQYQLDVTRANSADCENEIAYAQQQATEYANLLEQQQAEIEQLEAERIAAEEEARRQAEAEAAAAAAAEEAAQQEDQAVYDEEGNEVDADEAAENGDTVYDKEGNEVLHGMLAKVDEKSAKDIHPNNVKRVIRALEYFHQTGKKISEHNEEQSQNVSPYNFVYFVLNDDRKLLYERIDRRVDEMFEEGLEQEVKRLIDSGLTRESISMQGIGYKEMFDYFDGMYDIDTAKELIKQDTRHFAKRQLTWFRREKDVTWINYENYNHSKDDMLEAMIEIIKNKQGEI